MIVRCHLDHPYDNSVHSECPFCKSSGGYDEEGSTVPLATAPLQKPNAAEYDPKTVAFQIDKNAEKKPDAKLVNPVVGWLVCYEGLEKGKDYNIHFGQNSAGRDNNMDIVMKDGAISRNSHCFITYDHKHNRFFIQPGLSHGVTYKNEVLVAGATELVSLDKLEMGESKFIFIALCGENFKWE